MLSSNQIFKLDQEINKSNHGTKIGKTHMSKVKSANYLSEHKKQKATSSITSMQT
jgi:hypothetical protein